MEHRNTEQLSAAHVTEMSPAQPLGWCTFTSSTATLRLHSNVRSAFSSCPYANGYELSSLTALCRLRNDAWDHLMVRPPRGRNTTDHRFDILVNNVDGVTVTGTFRRDTINATTTVKGQAVGPMSRHRQQRGRQRQCQRLGGNDTLNAAPATTSSTVAMANDTLTVAPAPHGHGRRRQ